MNKFVLFFTFLLFTAKNQKPKFFGRIHGAPICLLFYLTFSLDSFQYCQPAQNQPKSQTLFHKNVLLFYLHIMTFVFLSWALESVQQRQVLLNAFTSYFRWSFTFSVYTELLLFFLNCILCIQLISGLILSSSVTFDTNWAN